MPRPRTSVNGKYTVDLRSQQAECEANYVRLCKLMPGLDQREHWEYAVPLPASSEPEEPAEHIKMALLERSAHTYTVEVKQAESCHAWEGARVLRVRLYHDARMAEVVAWNGHWNTRSRYPYPNKKMFHRDEKFQLNRFLGEWLAHCLARGRVVQSLTG